MGVSGKREGRSSAIERSTSSGKALKRQVLIWDFKCFSQWYIQLASEPSMGLKCAPLRLRRGPLLHFFSCRKKNRLFKPRFITALGRRVKGNYNLLEELHTEFGSLCSFSFLYSGRHFDSFRQRGQLLDIGECYYSLPTQTAPHSSDPISLLYPTQSIVNNLAGKRVWIKPAVHIKEPVTSVYHP